ncbi:MAG TPA: hypothetical protein VFD43_14080 [Planctomycetota bacterium]|nr:hypothetical protein [Planctomycetota bacterium]
MAGPSPAGGGLLSRLTSPWAWLLVLAVGFAIPLIKALRSELPPPLPGIDRPGQDSALPDETGASRSLSELRGRLVIVTALTLANAVERDAAFDGLRRLRKRLRGLGTEVAFYTVCSGGDAAGLGALLDAKKARRPTELYLLDAGGEEFARLAKAAGAASASFLLFDRHGRVRGAYGDSQDELDRLVEQTGQLANWVGQDPASGQP